MNHHATQPEGTGAPFLLRLSNLTAPQPKSADETAMIRMFERWTGGVTPLDAPIDETAFFTQASVLIAATRVVPSDRLWVTFDDIFAVNSQGDRIQTSSLTGAIGFGSTQKIDSAHAKDEPGWWLSRSAHSITTLDMLVCSYSGFGTDVTRVMRDAALAGQSRVHIRLGRVSKSAIVPVYASDDAAQDKDQNRSALIGAFGWDIAHVSGGTEDIVVTPEIEPTWEYRMWVVNGQVVTGAGIVEEFDPRSNRGSAFDLQNRERRSGGDVVIASPSRVETLVEFARVLAASNRDGGDLPQSFVVDFAWDGELPTIIDVNSIDGSALFAADPERIISALVA